MNENILRERGYNEGSTAVRWKEVELSNIRLYGMDLRMVSRFSFYHNTDHVIRQFWIGEWSIARDNFIMMMDQLAKHPDDPTGWIIWKFSDAHNQRQIHFILLALPVPSFGGNIHGP